MTIENFDNDETQIVKTIVLNPTWVAAVRIYIECLLHGDSHDAKKGAQDELLRMAGTLDKLNEARDSFRNTKNEPWEIQFCGGEYHIVYDNSRKRNSPAWFVMRLNDMAQSERFYSWPNGAFTALSENSIVWSK